LVQLRIAPQNPKTPYYKSIIAYSLGKGFERIY